MSAHSRQISSGTTPSFIRTPNALQPTHRPRIDSRAGKTTMTTPIVITTGLATPRTHSAAATEVNAAPIPAAKRFGGPAVGRLRALTRGRTKRCTPRATGLALGPVSYTHLTLPTKR